MGRKYKKIFCFYFVFIFYIVSSFYSYYWIKCNKVYGTLLLNFLIFSIGDIKYQNNYCRDLGKNHLVKVNSII
ncbi:hypothetical protein BpHYR1_043738 [Brachionus plicatilis]|uniref:Uncharacterized protein n=1 Tax=Brachionus plicatilis TaxID=10195 RepID=A0A3M7PIC3_BRAPC|nr:hypothetical protein BpHYR1_043738 [Brachionus plicatilis]